MRSAVKTEAKAADASVLALTPEWLSGLMQERGYRVETVSDVPLLRSATNGLAFEVRFHNPMAEGLSRYADVAFLAALRVEGELPPAIVADWNANRRFCRLYLHQNMLVLTMDVAVVGGTTTDYVHLQIEIWDRTIQDFMLYLRDALQALNKRTGETATAEAGETAAPAA